MNTQEKIEELKERERRERNEFDKRMEKSREEHEKQVNKADSILFPNLRRAHASDYKKWLKKAISLGVEPTHFYDYPMQRQDFYIAHSDFKTVPLYGASSINIIIPENVEYLGGGLGHINLYFMIDGVAKPDNSFVPIFEDTQFKD